MGVLFKRYTHLAVGAAMKYLKNPADAEDITMQVFEKLLKELKNKKVTYFKSYLYMTVKNQCLMQLRKKKLPIAPKLEEDLIENVGQLEEKQILEQKLELLEQSMEALPEEQQECIRLFFLEKKSYQEVQDLTGLDYKQVKSRIQNGKRNLKRLMHTS